MIKEPIQLEPHYFELSNQIIEKIQEKNLFNLPQLVIGICGESGCGKTVTTQCLKIQLEKMGKKVATLHMDSYFKLPPKENHLKRKENIEWVGVNEVKLDWLQQHIQQFKNRTTEINIPVVDYVENKFFDTCVDLKEVSILIIEGVYTFHLSDLDLKIYLERTYQDTIQTRKERSREVYDTFVEQVLEIEHLLALKQKDMADLIIGKDYKLK